MQQQVRDRGFTLIEVLVAVAIIALLSSIILVSTSRVNSKGRDARRLSDVESIRSALELYAAAHGGSYPSTSGRWVSSINRPSDWIPNLTPKYIEKLPIDPFNSSATLDTHYYYASNGINYCLQIPQENPCTVATNPYYQNSNGLNGGCHLWFTTSQAYCGALPVWTPGP